MVLAKLLYMMDAGFDASCMGSMESELLYVNKVAGRRQLRWSRCKV